MNDEIIEFHLPKKKVLLVYPEHPKETYWSFSGTMKLINKRATMPPLGLITIAAMLPETYELRLIDMNIEPLQDADLLWADVVFTSTMIVQKDSLELVIQRANRLGVPLVAGGPHPSSSPESIKGATHIIVGEAEAILSEFLADYEKGCAKPIYEAQERPDIVTTPMPRFDLLKRSAYASMSVQYSRGCPYLCDFCDIWKLYGRRPRIKTTEQFLAELQALYDLDWRGSLFVVDDNFIGNPKRVKIFLKELVAWQAERDYPFSLYTEASVNIASDDKLLNLMRDAGFNMVFLGIETPAVESLAESNKSLNLKTDLYECVTKIQKAGIEVSGGFIVGFDSDPQDIAERQIEFIQKAGIPMAMVGMLVALPGTELYKRLAKEGRILEESDGNNTHMVRPNFVTLLPADQLADRYKQIITSLYDRNLKLYFKRCRTFLGRLGVNPHFSRNASGDEVRAFFLTLRALLTHRWGWQYLRFLLWCVCGRMRHFPEAVRLAIMGFHFQSITHGAIASHAVEGKLARVELSIEEALRRLGDMRDNGTAAVKAAYQTRAKACRHLRRQIGHLKSDFRLDAEVKYGAFLTRVDGLFTRYVPRSAQIPMRGAELWAEVQAFFAKEEESFAKRYTELRQRAGQGLVDMQRGMNEMYRDRKRRLREAKRRIRALPKEYRLLAKREYRHFRAGLLATA